MPRITSRLVTHLSDDQNRHVRGSIADVERRLNGAKDALGQALVSLDNADPEGARYALDEAELEIVAAGREAHNTNQALAIARERSAP